MLLSNVLENELHYKLSCKAELLTNESLFYLSFCDRIFVGTTNGRRLALLLKSKGVLPMSINELIGLLGAFASFFGLGYMIGSDKAKK